MYIFDGNVHIRQRTCLAKSGCRWHMLLQIHVLNIFYNCVNNAHQNTFVKRSICICAM